MINYLGDFAGVWPYWKDKQLKEVAFREVDADHVSCRVTVTELRS